MRRLALPLLLLLAFAPAPALADDPVESARERLIVALEAFVAASRSAGDLTAAQALAEVASVVSGAPHADLDALRTHLRTRYAADKADSTWLASDLAGLEPDARRLVESDDGLDQRDGVLVLGLGSVLPAMRALNTARLRAGLVPVRYDAPRSGKRAALALGFPAAGEHEGTLVLHAAPEAAMREALERLAWRMALLDPPDKGAVVTTVRKAGRVVTCVGISGNREVVFQGPFDVAWPPDGQTAVPPRTTEPTPAALLSNGNAWGPWISLGFYADGAVVALDAAELLDADGAVVRITWGTARAARLGLPRVHDAVLVRPIQALLPGTRYTVRARGKVDGNRFEREWSFETAKH